MAELRSGLFTLEEFTGRNVLKLAPDMFIVTNGALGAHVTLPIRTDGTESFSDRNLEVRGGLSSVNVNCAVEPSGANRASIEIVAPIFKGLHEDYYITMPNGTKIPKIGPMNEIQIYMKGRYLTSYGQQAHPKYYPVFWGLVTDVSESYGGGNFTISLTCSDILVWWKYQQISIRPGTLNTLFGSPVADKYPTVFENMNPWEIIYALFLDNFFVSSHEKDDVQNNVNYNFIYPTLSKSGREPNFGDINASEVFSQLAQDVISYWDKRFGFKGADPDDPNRIPLDMFGLRGELGEPELETIKDAVLSDDRKKRTAWTTAKLNLDYNILANIQPFGALSLYGDGSQPTIQTKLDIAIEICKQTHFEFFVDTNGHLVFKPPFYNLNVKNDTTPEYIIDAKDIINFQASFSSDKICNYLEVTAPQIFEDPSLEVNGYHMDWDSIKKYGIRYQQQAMRYGQDSRTLRNIAVAEMARINGAAFTATCSIPLRPEIRLGYPVYVKHIDAYYYMTGISHSFTYGSAARTDLALEFRRDRIFDDGTVTGEPGKVLSGYVYRFREQPITSSDGTPEEKQEAAEKAEEIARDQEKTIEELKMDIKRDDYKRTNNIITGPKSTGFYELTPYRPTPVSEDLENPDQEDAFYRNELVMLTDTTVPYTDAKGYRHIGAFPYGANLSLLSTSNLSNQFNLSEAAEAQLEQVLQADGYELAAPVRSEVSSREPVNDVDMDAYRADTTDEQSIGQHQENTDAVERAETNAVLQGQPGAFAEANGSNRGLNVDTNREQNLREVLGAEGN